MNVDWISVIPATSPPPLIAYAFTGEWWEQDVRLLHLCARWYDPGNAVFLSKDPAEGFAYMPTTLNRYNYVSQNPINLTDPTGFFRGGPEDAVKVCSEMPACQAAVKTGGGTVVGLAALLSGPVGVVVITFTGILVVCGFFECTPYTPSMPPQPVPTPQIPYPTSTPIPQPQPQPWPHLGPSPVPVPQPAPAPQPQPIPIPVPVPPNQCNSCDPVAFAKWWNSLPTVGGSRPGEGWYDYEQLVTRGPGTVGGVVPRRVPAGAERVDADGAESTTCRLLDAKFSSDHDVTQFREGGPPWIINDIPDQIRRYRLAIITPNNVPGAQPTGLVIITNAAQSQPFFENQLQSRGFLLNVDGFVNVTP